MPSTMRKNRSSGAKAPAAKREKTTEIIDLTEENKENLPVDGTKNSFYSPLIPPQEAPPSSAATRNTTQRMIQQYGLSWVAGALRPSKTFRIPSDPDTKRQSKVEEDEKVDRIRAAMTAGPDTLFVVEAEQDEEYEGRVGGCIAIHKTLDGALGSALKYLDDYGTTDAIIGELDDDYGSEKEEVNESDEDDDEDIDKEPGIKENGEDFDDEWKRINALLDVAELSGEGKEATLTIMEEDDESTTFTITIAMMKIGA